MANRTPQDSSPPAIILLFQVVLGMIIWILELQTVRLQVEVPEMQCAPLQDLELHKAPERQALPQRAPGLKKAFVLKDFAEPYSAGSSQGGP